MYTKTILMATVLDMLESNTECLLFYDYRFTGIKQKTHKKVPKHSRIFPQYHSKECKKINYNRKYLHNRSKKLTK